MKIIETCDLESNKVKHWQEHLVCWRRSGLNQSQYCRQQGLRWHTFHYWRKKPSVPDWDTFRRAILNKGRRGIPCLDSSVSPVGQDTLSAAVPALSRMRALGSRVSTGISDSLFPGATTTLTAAGTRVLNLGLARRFGQAGSDLFYAGFAGLPF